MDIPLFSILDHVTVTQFEVMLSIDRLKSNFDGYPIIMYKRLKQRLRVPLTMLYNQPVIIGWLCTTGMANFGRFLPSQILRGRSPPQKKSCSQLSMPASRHVTWRSFVRLLPVIGSHMLHFGPIFEFIILKIFWRTPVPHKCGLASLGHCVTHVKISVSSAP